VSNAGSFLLMALFLLAFGCKQSELRFVEKSALQELSSPDWQIQEQSLDKINHLQSKGYALSQEIRVALAHVFQKQIQVKNDQHSSEYGEYLVALAASLSAMKEESSLPVIFQFMVNNTDYVINIAWPIHFGGTAFDFLLNKFAKGTAQEKEMAMRVLSVWAVPGESGDFDMSTVPPLSERQKQQLLPIFLTAIHDPSLEIRYLATIGLAIYVDSAEVRKVLQELSFSSPRDDIKREAVRILNNVK